MLDVVASCVALVILVIPFLLIAIIIRIESKGPVLFKQKRYGKDKVPFECYKFRTMLVTAPSDRPTRKLKNAHSYITFSGRILRRLGIDELPQLFNILKGEMSFIGPRPVVLAETDLINERDKYGANACVPGIGGWAQSNGRDEIDTKEKARLDGEYTQNFGLRMDLSCVWRTAIAIFTSEGFKEGHFGDDAYRKKVRSLTRVKLRAGRLYARLSQNTKARMTKLTGSVGKQKTTAYRKEE